MNLSPCSTFEGTIASQFRGANDRVNESASCCLVQIYPTNVVDGLTLIEGNKLSIGREPLNDLALSDTSVSRQHATLDRCESGFMLRDRGSTNGTYVNDNKIHECLLSGGETLRFGSFIFKFLRAIGIEAQYHATVYDAMTRDGLTGAFNKSYLMDSLSHEIARSNRSLRPLSVTLMDIDYFKKINDTYGHLVGDEILREFALRVRSSKRKDDLFCRYGGEEFVLISGETNAEEAVQLAERIRLAVHDKLFETTVGPVKVSVSMGVAEMPLVNSLGEKELLERADVLLNQAKNEGRNRVSCA